MRAVAKGTRSWLWPASVLAVFVGALALTIGLLLPTSGRSAASEFAAQGASATSAAGSATSEIPGRQVVRESPLLTSVPGPGTGTLEVVVRDASGAAARGVMVGALDATKEPRHRRWKKTDDQGTVAFTAVPEGRVNVTLDRAIVGGPGVAQVVRDRTSRLLLVLANELWVVGSVIDTHKRPVGGAAVVLCGEASIDEEAAVLSHADLQGRFELKVAYRTGWIGARARNHGASNLQPISAEPGDARPIEVVLELPSGGNLEGRVSDTHGRPIAGATIRVGRGDVDTITRIGNHAAAPIAARARSDEMGRYAIEGAPVGEQPVFVRADGFAPWAGTCRIEEGKTQVLEIEVHFGGKVVGRVEGSDGSGVPGAVVQCGERGSLSFLRQATAADGSFSLAPLAEGRMRLTAEKAGLGTASADLTMIRGEVNRVVLVLSRKGSVSGKVVFEDGSPLVDARVEVVKDGKRFPTLTDGYGSFELVNLEPGPASVVVQHRHADDVRLKVTIPAQLEIAANRKRPGRGAIHGRVLLDDGSAVHGASVAILCPSSPVNSETVSTDRRGVFSCDGLYEGTYRIRVEKGGLPVLVLTERRLEASDSWAVGDLVLGAGGTIRVVPPRYDIPGVATAIYFEDFKHAAFIPDGLVSLVSEPLRPGHYHVFLTGKGLASESHRVLVTAGREAVVQAKCERGRLRAIVVESTMTNGAPQAWVSCFVSRDGKPFARKGGWMVAGKCDLELCLAPGAYDVDLKCSGATKRIRLDVGDQVEEAPLRVPW